MSRKEGVVGRENAFFEFFLRKASTTPPPARPIYPRGGDPSPQRTRTDCTAQAAGQAVPDAGQTMQGKARTLHRVDRTSGGRWRLHNVSETVQIWTHSNMNNFQHKNVCKAIDINTRTCYYIDNTRTCYTTTKQEDKNHEKDH